MNVFRSCVFFWILRFLIVGSSVCISRIIGVVIVDWWLLLWSIERCVVDIRTDDGDEYKCVVGSVNWTDCWEEFIDSEFVAVVVDGNNCIWI